MKEKDRSSNILILAKFSKINGLSSKQMFFLSFDFKL